MLLNDEVYENFSLIAYLFFIENSSCVTVHQYLIDLPSFNLTKFALVDIERTRFVKQQFGIDIQSSCRTLKSSVVLGENLGRLRSIRFSIGPELSIGFKSGL